MRTFGRKSVAALLYLLTCSCAAAITLKTAIPQDFQTIRTPNDSSDPELQAEGAGRHQGGLLVAEGTAAYVGRALSHNAGCLSASCVSSSFIS